MLQNLLSVIPIHKIHAKAIDCDAPRLTLQVGSAVKSLYSAMHLWLSFLHGLDSRSRDFINVIVLGTWLPWLQTLCFCFVTSQDLARRSKPYCLMLHHWRRG